MSVSITEYLSHILQAGPFLIGQVVVMPDFVMTHADEANAEDLAISTDPYEALEIARYDDAGKYRPLKSAANLRHGWRLELRSVNEVLLALDFLYPAAMGALVAWEQGSLRSTSVRQTLARQSGMYAVVKKISDEQIHVVKASLCGGTPSCLRKILWQIDPPSDSIESGQIDGNTAPILCEEICNLFVAEGRKVVKKAAEPAAAAVKE